MKRFTNNIVSIKRGDADVDKVYKGAVQIWPDDEPSFEEFILTSADNNTLRKWSLSGVQDTTGNWPKVFSGAVRINAIVHSFDEQRIMITGHRGIANSVAGYETLDMDGNSIYTNGALGNFDTRTLAIEENGDYYPEATPQTKFDKNNNVLWTRTLTRTTRNFQSYFGEGIYSVGGARGSNLSIALIYSDNSSFLEFDTGGDNRGLHLKGNRLLTAVANTVIKKYTLSGLTPTLSWTYNHGQITIGVIEGENENIYFEGFRSSNITHRKLDKDGNLLWSRDHGANSTDKQNNPMDIDSEGNIWFTFVRSSNLTHRKYAPDGTLLLSIDHGVNGNAVKVVRKKL